MAKPRENKEQRGARIIANLIVWHNGDGSITYTVNNGNVPFIQEAAAERGLDTEQRPIDLLDQLIVQSDNLKGKI